jgi:hypothetical protein
MSRVIFPISLISPISLFALSLDSAISLISQISLISPISLFALSLDSAISLISPISLFPFSLGSSISL